MKSIFKWGVLLVFFLNLQTSEAQLLKRLKNKINQKLEQKTEEKVDKKIEEIFTKKQKKTKKKEDTNRPVASSEKNIDFGDVVITHSNTYGAVQIFEVSKIKVIQSNSGWNFEGSWWSHEADIHDGFFLSIKTTDDLRHDTNKENGIKRTFKIPEEATLKLSYDPLLPYNKTSESNFKKAVTDEYQTYNVSKGEISIDVLSEGDIQISFSGKVTLKKIVRHSSNSEDYSESFFEASVKGGIEGSTPEFRNNQTISKNDEDEEAVTSWDDMVKNEEASAGTPGVYQFSFETEVLVTVPEQNRSYKMSYLLNPNTKYMAIKADMSEYSDEDMAGESIIVVDGSDTHIFVETQGMKMQMSQGMMGGKAMENPTAKMAAYDYSKLTKTGETKTILGAFCEEYSMSDADVKMNLWVAPKINLPNWFVQNKDLIKGHILEYTINSKDGNMKSEVVAIKDNISKTINPKDYRKMF